MASFGRIGISCKNIHEVVKDEVIADKIVKDGKSPSISRLIWGLTTLKHVEGCRGILEALERKEVRRCEKQGDERVDSVYYILYIYY